MIHIPLLRAGEPYKSLSTIPLKDFRNGEPLAKLSQANTGLIAKDLAAASQNKQSIEALSISELLIICKRAAHLFSGSTLPLDESASQSPEDYIRQTSCTTGMPQGLCRKNMAKIHLVLDNMKSVLEGLTRSLDLAVLDHGALQNISYLTLANTLGVILPNNSPGVHTLWLPAIPLKIPLALKPGSDEPWTPYRIAQAFIAAGCPQEFFGFYPTDHSGANEILMRCERLMLFGDESTVRKWIHDRRVQIHGPGKSKILIANDQALEWEKHLDVMITSILENAGRSCINASGIWVTSHSRQIAESLAQQLARVTARTMEDPEAQLAAFTNPKVAHRISDLIDQYLRIPGAEDITAKFRKGPRLVELDGCAFLLPTIILCQNPDHPLANMEFLFPFASVVQTSQEEMVQRMGPTLVLTALTKNESLIHELLGSSNIDRLNIGPVPTNQLSWYQPHEGNLFEHLYRQRSLQMSAGILPA